MQKSAKAIFWHPTWEDTGVFGKRFVPFYGLLEYSKANVLVQEMEGQPLQLHDGIAS